MQQVKDSEVLAGLGGYAFIGGDDEQNRVDSSDACQHIADKIPVTGHVNDAHPLPVGEREGGKAQVNRHLPLAFFLQTVRVGARQSGDQG